VPSQRSAWSTQPSPLPQLGKALAVCVVAGLLLAALAFPVVGGLGLSAKAGADEFLVLPAELKTPPLAQRSRILAADGSLIATLYSQNRVLVPLSDVPEHTRKAVLAIEDSRFYAHNGVDPKGTLRAAIANAKANGVAQGGSTLTQQYVKNALLQAARTEQEQDAAREVSLERKVREARYALAIEGQLSKDEILERYINIAYYGNGVYGLGTAANYYFGKPVQELTVAEGAMLAGIVQSPGRFDPVKNLDAAIERRNTVLMRMAELGFLTEAERAEAAGGRPEITPNVVGSECDDPTVTAPFFCDYIRRALEADDALGRSLGSTLEERQNRLLAGGLTIKTSLDPLVQGEAQRAAEEQVPVDDPFGAAAVVDVVEPGTGLVKAMAVNRRFSEEDLPGHTKVNLAIGGSSGFQAGSTFKIFVLTEALRQGIPLSFTLYAPQKYRSPVFEKCVGCGPYEPQNAGDSESGTFDLIKATHDSVNTYYVQLEERTGVEKPAALAESLGVQQFADGRPSAPLNRGGAFTLGGNEVSPLAMAAAYATFAAHGKYCPPRAVTEILDERGQPIPLPEAPPCTQALEPRIADTVTSVLTGVIDGNTPGRTGRRASIGRPAAGKTGTTNGSRAAWFVGYTPQLSTAVWVGTPGTPQEPVKEMRNVRINGQFYRQVYGGTIPATIWRQTMSAALKDAPVQNFAARDPDVADGDKTSVPDVTGQPTETARQTLIEAGFSVRIGDTVSGSKAPRGTVAYTSPRAGRSAAPGATVTVYTSNGRARRQPASAPTRAAKQPSPAPAPVRDAAQPADAPQAEPEPSSSEREKPGNGNGNGNGGGGGGGGG
jgi:membrane peptidoglycan carboxypeptidase